MWKLVRSSDLILYTLYHILQCCFSSVWFLKGYRRFLLSYTSIYVQMIKIKRKKCFIYTAYNLSHEPFFCHTIAWMYMLIINFFLRLLLKSMELRRALYNLLKTVKVYAVRWRRIKEITPLFLTKSNVFCIFPYVGELFKMRRI